MAVTGKGAEGVALAARAMAWADALDRRRDGQQAEAPADETDEPAPEPRAP